MTPESPTLMRCERCRALIASAEASELIRDGVSCGVCGGRLTLCDDHGRWRAGGDRDGPSARSSSPERRLLGVLRDAHGQPVAPQELTQAGINDPASAIYELELAGHRIRRAYSAGAAGRRRFLGYCL